MAGALMVCHRGNSFARLAATYETASCCPTPGALVQRSLAVQCLAWYDCRKPIRSVETIKPPRRRSCTGTLLVMRAASRTYRLERMVLSRSHRLGDRRRREWSSCTTIRTRVGDGAQTLMSSSRRSILFLTMGYLPVKSPSPKAAHRCR